MEVAMEEAFYAISFYSLISVRPSKKTDIRQVQEYRDTADAGQSQIGMCAGNMIKSL